jgi:hypothetical protein
MTASVSEFGGTSEIAAYDGASGYSEYGSASTGGRKRGKRNSRRRSRKYMKRMYRGGAEDASEEEPPAPPEPEPEPELESETPPPPPPPPGLKVGGRRRKGKTHKGKMHKGKMHRMKTRKGKKVSKWITHVKNFSRANKMDFRDALKDPRCKAAYHKMK